MATRVSRWSLVWLCGCGILTMCCGGCLKLGVIIAVILGVLLGSLQVWMNSKKFLFNRDYVAAITSDALEKTKGQSANATLKLVENRLRNDYGDHILAKGDTKWIFINCGGWMGAMYLLHASLTEYVLFFGTGIDTSGHSGRYWAEISDTIVQGTMRQWKEGGMIIKEYSVGDTIFHGSGEVTGVQWTSGTLMVEYGRGLIPTTLLFALADTIFSTTDYYLLYEILKLYSKAIGGEIMQGNL